MYNKTISGILSLLLVLSLLSLSACSKASDSDSEISESVTAQAAGESENSESATAQAAEESDFRFEEDTAFKEELTELVDEFKEELAKVTEGFIEEPEEISESMTEYEEETQEEPPVSEKFDEVTIEEHHAYEGVISSLNHSQSHTISPYFTDQQIYDIALSLKVPVEKSMGIHIGDMYYWEGADTYLCNIDFYKEGEYAAGAACVPNTSTPARSIYTYTE